MYGIERQHDGYIDLQSSVGVGTTFILYLPMSDEEIHEQRLSDARVTSRGNGETILIVEDDTVVLKAICAMAEGIGYQAIEARDGGEAIDLLSRTPTIQLILTDVVMPGINGIELAQIVNRDYPDIPLIMMTGHTLDEQEAIEQNAAAFLNKPLSLAELAATFKSLLP